MRKIFKEAGGASNDSSRAKGTKKDEDGDDADEGDAVSPRFVSTFAAAACVINFGIETCRKKIAPGTTHALSAVNLVKARFKSSRIMDWAYLEKKIKGLPYYRLRRGQ